MNIDKVWIQRQLKVHEIRNIIGHIIYKPKLLLVNKLEKSRLSKMCYVTLESVLIDESRGPKHNRLGLSKALHPSSFHCCHLQDPFMYPCILPFRPVRSSVSSAMGFTLPAKYL